MNATQTAILTAITDTASHDVKTIVNEIGKSETTVRKGLNELEAAGEVYRDGSCWYAVVNPVDTANDNEAYTKLMDETETEIADDESNDDDVNVYVTKKYTRHETPTTRTVRTNQITGAEVQVVKNGETDRDGNEISITNKWATVCLTHRAIGQFSRVLDAHFASSYPEFCPTCKDAMPIETIGRRRRK